MQHEDDFSAPGTILWAVDVELENAVFRKGAASKAGVDFLRFIDIGIHDQSGRIESNPFGETQRVTRPRDFAVFEKDDT